VGQAKAGQTYPITGKSADGKWLVVNLGGKQGWVLGQFVKANGSLDGLTVVKAPAAPKAAAKAAAAPRPTPPGFFGYGIQIDPGADRGAAISAIKGLGFNWVKFQMPWKNFEGGGPGVRNWPDDVVGDLNGNGLNILASIVKAPNWARPGNTNLARHPIRAPTPALSVSSRRATAAACRPSKSGTNKTCGTSGAASHWMPDDTCGCSLPPIGPLRPHAQA
jgi:hypothetical protein